MKNKPKKHIKNQYNHKNFDFFMMKIDLSEKEIDYIIGKFKRTGPLYKDGEEYEFEENEKE